MAFPALRLAVGTLTILPSGPIGEISRRQAGRAMLLAPLAVLPLAAFATLIGWVGVTLGLPRLVVGLLMVAVLAIGTRAMHLDGLADTVDGLGSGWDRDRALSIMRKGDVGPMGVVALIVVIGLQAVAFGQLAGGLAVGAAICASRAALSIVCSRGIVAARSQGLGVAVAGSVPRWATTLTWLAVTALMIVVAAPHWAGIAATLAAAAIVVAVVGHAVHRLGGVTGDVMGAAVEFGLTALLLGLLLR